MGSLGRGAKRKREVEEIGESRSLRQEKGKAETMRTADPLAATHRGIICGGCPRLPGWWFLGEGEVME